MIQLPHINARIARLHELTINFGKEVVAQRDAEGVLLPQERRQYLNGLQTGLAELDAARVVLVVVVKRREGGPAQYAGVSVSCVGKAGRVATGPASTREPTAGLPPTTKH